MNIEDRSEFVDRDASFMHQDDLGYLLVGQSGLFLAERWDGSMGRSVTPLTRENAVQTRHVVGVGITSHHLHCRCRFDNV